MCVGLVSVNMSVKCCVREVAVGVCVGGSECV